jgi:hypothetical protein
VSPGPSDGPQPQNPGRLAIFRAIPAGSRRARDQGSWLRAVVADPEIAALRADRRRAVLELARVLARHADWRTMTSWRPRALACDEIGSSRDPSRPLSISAYKAARRVLEERGFLGLVAQGWTSALRAAVLDDHSSTSAVFVLAIPRRKERLPSADEAPPVNRPLAGSRREPDIAPRAREASPEVKPEKARAPRGQPVLPRASAALLGATPQNRSEALAAARAMQERVRLLRRISGEHLRHLARPFFAAGWTPRDVLHALDYEPGGRQHGYSTAVRSAVGWIRFRLAAWLGPDGIPLPSRSQQLAGARRRVLAEQAARREAAASARVADYPAQAARARELLLRRPRPEWRRALIPQSE